MCYDISFTVNVKQLTDYFPDLIYEDMIRMDFENAAHIIGHAYGLHPILFRHRDDEKVHCKLMEWGCVPFYVKELKTFTKQRASMLNARQEKILDDAKSYWNKIRNRRCLVPLTGFYEHRKVQGMKNKVPYLIRLKEQEMFFLPGLYSVAKVPDENGEVQEVWSFTIITTKANELMAQIHNDGDNANRMPLLLPKKVSDAWLDHNLEETDYRKIIGYEMASAQLDYQTVYTIRSPKERPDGKLKNEAYDWGELPAIQH